MDAAFDYVVLVTAPADVRRRRLTAKLTDSEFARRLAQQMPEEEKVRRASFVFHNTGARRELREFVRETVARVLAGDGGHDTGDGTGASR
jgi:dephospho-CoA kinase